MAVVLVILFHTGTNGFTGGYIGVDVFFVISGFLITGLIRGAVATGTFTFDHFYERRIRRIISALFLVILVSFALGWSIMLPSDLAGLARSAAATTAFVSNIWFYRTTDHYFDKPAEFSPLLHTWSLAVEEQFYIVFPILLVALMRLFPPRVVIGVLLVLCIASFALSMHLTAEQPAAAFYLAHSRARELGIGALLALGLVQTIPARPLREAAAVAVSPRSLAPRSSTAMRRHFREWRRSRRRWARRR